MAIERVKCRARVEIAGITVETPFVQSFNVRKQRGQISTFDVSLKVPATTSATLAGGDVKIYAGVDSANTLIFTGMCRAAKVSLCYDDPYYVILSASGADKMILLQGKKFTRRCRATKSSWCSITGVVRQGLKSGKFAYSTEPTLELGPGDLYKQNNLVAPRDSFNPSTPAKVSDGDKREPVQMFVNIESNPVTGGGA